MNRYLRPGVVCAVLCGIAAITGTAVADTPWDYRPVVINGVFTDARTAHIIAEPDKGHIGYHQARDAAPALWFRFEGNYGDRVRLRMGVPALDRYRLLRPAIAVLGQGLPPIDETIPFAMPEGDFGGVVYHAADLDIERYEDKYTGAVSWRFETIEHILESTGRVYVVGFIPMPRDPETEATFEEGKFWMTMGHKVNFRLRDLAGTYARTARIRNFFEDAVTNSNLYRNGVMGLIISVITLMIAVS
ncbi:MAG TPA: hypothetical protein ENN29_09055 [Candidatus Hydrogenedentes bacterium]|nr:hypothetical protein [Candidatus Hydrogenedentota bacterium]